MTPANGVRFELTRQDAPATEIRYAVELQAPEQRWQSEAAVRLADGEVTVAAFDPEPPAWTLATLRAFLRGEWRSRRDPDPEPWPQRITRWRTER